MQVLYKLIEVACPRCGKEKIINVPETLFSEKKFGHIKIQVPKGAVCPDHVFVVFLDVTGRIIGYQTVDLSISSEAETKSREEIRIEDDNIFSIEKFIDLIGFNCFAGLIHAKLFNYPLVLIMSDGINLNIEMINNFLVSVMPEKYKNTRHLEAIKYDNETFPTATYFYALVKNQRKTAFLMNPGKHIIQMPWKTGLELEKEIINSALKEGDQKKQLRNLEFFISKFLQDVDNTLLILDSVKKISKKNLVSKLKDISITSIITKNRVNFFKEFIHRRISPQIANKIQD
ncbi:MAG: hypothetical protein ACFFDH_12630 [Promethearchaeota archaeon]